MFALVGQVERALPRPRGVPGDRPGGDDRRSRRLRRGADGARRRCRPPSATRSARRSVGRPGPVLLSLPEDLLDEVLPDGHGARHRRARRRPGRSRTTSAPCSSSSRPRERPVILAGGGVLRARTSTDLVRLAELLDVPVIAGWRRGDVISNDHPLYLGMAGYGSPERRPRAARGGRRAARHRLPAVGDHVVRLRRSRRAGQRWAHVDIEPLGARPGLAAAGAHGPRRRPGVPARRRRAARGGACSTPRVPTPGSAVNADGSGRLGGGDRRRRDRLGRPRRPSRPRDRDAPAAPARRRDRHHRRRQLRAVARPPLPVPPARHVPRPDVRRDGLRPAGGDRRRARPSRPGGRRVRRRRRLRDDDGRARDRGPREGQGRSRSSSTTSATARSGCTRTGGARETRPGRDRHRPRADRLRRDRPGRAAPAGSASRRTPRSSRPSARRSSRIGRRSSSSSSTGAG